MDAIEAKMIQAYTCALRASHGSGSVNIRVGRAAWDWMRAKATVEDPDAVPGRPWLAKAWGFPVTLESAWEPDRVVVRIEHEVTV